MTRRAGRKAAPASALEPGGSPGDTARMSSPPLHRTTLAAAALLALLALAAPARAFARPEDAYWLSVGIGAGTLASRDYGQGDFGRFAAETSLFFQRGSRVIGVRATSTDGKHNTDSWDVGALVGVATPADSRLHAVAAGGLGYASHSIEGQPHDEQAPRRNGLCVPLEAEVTYRPSYLVGIGGFAYASLKSGESAAGIGAVVQVGRLR